MDRSLKYTYAVCVSLVVMILAIYAQVYAYDFVNFDDDLYVSNNDRVKQGLTSANVAWAFTTADAANWHPMTWLSHMLDVQLFGVHSGPIHLVNVFFHALNAVFLFLLLRNMTKALWPSALVAALFAVHPLHVESVAWISERKDVLSTFFWLLTMAAYVAYVRRPGVLRYLLIMLLFALGLMAKSILVTLPAVFLLLDYWPLGRFADGAADASEKGKTKTGGKGKKKKNRDRAMGWRRMQPQIRRCVLDKLPLFALTVASSVIAFLAQRGGEGVTALDALSVKLRIGNALLSYGRYLWMMVFPQGLAVFYPHFVEGLPLGQVFLSCLLLVCISAGVILAARRYPFLIVGWLWYLGTLVPVIGIVQVGAQALADRYTYVPLTGIFLMAAWGGAAGVARWRIPKAVVAGSVGAVLLVLSVLSFVQVRYWRDSLTLFSHAVAVDPLIQIAHMNMGIALADLDRFDEAEASYQEGLKITPKIIPRNADLHYNYGNLLREMKRPTEAAAEYEKAIEVDPDYYLARYNLAKMFETQGKYEEAVRYYKQVIEQKPDHRGAHINLGNTFVKLGRPEEAAAEYKKAIKIDPNYYAAHHNLANTLRKQGKLREAADAFSETLRLDPGNAAAAKNLAQIEAELNSNP